MRVDTGDLDDSTRSSGALCPTAPGARAGTTRSQGTIRCMTTLIRFTDERRKGVLESVGADQNMFDGG